MQKIIFFLAFLLCLNLHAALECWVHAVKGKVTFKPEGKQSWYTLKKGAKLMAGDKVRTAPESFAVMAFGNGSLTRIAPASTILIKSLKYKVKKARLNAELEIPEKGKLMSAIKKLQKGAKSDFQVISPHNVAAVRGTTLMVDVPDPETTIVAVFEGKVIVADFVKEQGMSQDDLGMMMDFLNEITISAGTVSTYKKDTGFEKTEAIGKDMAEDQNLAEDLGAEVEEVMASVRKEDMAKKDLAAAKLREREP